MTTVPAAKAALQTILTAALPNDAQVVYGPGSSVTTTRDRMMIVGAADPGNPSVVGVITPTSIDGLHCTEIYDITVEASVVIRGTDSQGAESTALGDAATAITAVQTNPTLGISGLHASVDGGFELSEAANEYGRAAVVRFPVHIQAAF